MFPSYPNMTFLVAAVMCVCVSLTTGGQPHRPGKFKSVRDFLHSLTPRARRQIRVLSAARNVFTVSLHKEIGLSAHDVIYSPHSIHQALTMTSMGARGATALQMKKTLGLQDLGRSAHRANKRIQRMLNKANKSTLETAVAMFVRLETIYSVQQDFASDVQRFYKSKILPMEWRNAGDPEASINTWVSNHTHNLIPNILSRGTVDGNTALLLVNVIYFKAKWKVPFDSQKTSRQMFRKTTSVRVPVHLMEVRGRFRIRDVPGHAARVLELPYEGDHFSMLVILPDDFDGLFALEGDLTAKVLAITLKRVRPVTVKVLLPRFKLETSLSLKHALKSMKIMRAFDSALADFSGISDKKGLYIDDVLHRAVVDVDEKGSEATAATGVPLHLRSPARQSPDFRCDHPFLFIIRDNVSNVNLFVGKFSGGK